MKSAKILSKLISESIDEHHDDPAMEPEHFAAAVNAIIAATEHGKQAEAIKKLIEIGTNKGRLIDLLEKVERNVDAEGYKYVQDFYRSKASNIMLLQKLAQTAYDNEEAVAKVLDTIELGYNSDEDSADEDLYDEDEDEDLYNSEGDGYSH